MITFGTNSASCVPDELPLGHLVLDVGRAQVDGEEDQGKAHHVSDDRLRSDWQRVGWNATIITIELDRCSRQSMRLTQSQRTWPGKDCTGRIEPGVQSIINVFNICVAMFLIMMIKSWPKTAQEAFGGNCLETPGPRALQRIVCNRYMGQNIVTTIRLENIVVGMIKIGHLSAMGRNVSV